MIVLDFETTDLLSAKPLEEQPYVIEIAAIKLDDRTLETIAHFTTLVKPPIPLPDIVIKTTGLTDADLKDARSFAAYFRDLSDFCLGERILAGHNISYDHGVLVCELQRLGKEYLFPWPGALLCTMERSAHLFPSGKYPKLTELHEHLFGESFTGAHRAMTDTEATVRVIRALREKAII